MSMNKQSVIYNINYNVNNHEPSKQHHRNNDDVDIFKIDGKPGDYKGPSTDASDLFDIEKKEELN